MCTMQLFTEGWEFARTRLGTELDGLEAAGDVFEPVELPHDWLIGDSRRLYEDSCGWYRKKLELPRCLPERVILRFDGVYMDSTLYVDGRKAGDWKYGYSTFEMDITELVHPGENTLLLQVRFQSPNSRWYSGAGIYRRVWLQMCGRAGLPADGCRVETTECRGGFLLEVATEVECNDQDMRLDGEMECRYFLYRDGTLERELGRQQWCRVAGPQERENVYLARQGGRGGRILMMGIRAEIPSPALWEPEKPECYELAVELWQGEVQLDGQKITVGFRTMAFDPKEGFLLNGKRVKVHGVCEHHDLGCLGAAFSPWAMERKLCILRGMGVNAIRTSHNMPDPQVMELADRMGFLVMSEAFDMWESSKTPYDYGRFFTEWARRDVAAWIRRDRNHPSLMLWSIGNEIGDTTDEKRGPEITERLVQWVRAHDRRTGITIGSNYMFWESARKCTDLLKIAGVNYGEKYYRELHEKYPDWVIYGSETASVVQSRGIYHFPASRSILADEDEQCSALGNSATSWGAASIEKCITDDRDTEFGFGQFLWTGFDYIGEPTPYHTKNSYFGQVDTAGFPKDSYYIFMAEWTDGKKNPMVHLFPYWDFNEGLLIDVRACTNQPWVELFVNGVSQGRQRIDHARGRRLLGEWQVRYTPGTIRAAAYDEDGRETAWDSHTSFGDSRTIRLTPDRNCLRAGSGELCFLTIETLDEKGNLVENAADYVRVDVSGAGRLAGLDNGDSTDYDSYRSCCRKLFSGKLLAVAEAGGQAGALTVRVEGPGLEPAQISIPVLPWEDAGQARKPGTDAGQTRMSGGKEAGSLPVPVRKIELRSKNSVLTAQHPETEVEAVVYPRGAHVERLIWKVVNDGGIEVDCARIEDVREAGGGEEPGAREDLGGGEEPGAGKDLGAGEEPGAVEDLGAGKDLNGRREAGEDGGLRTRVKVRALGDGVFRVRCMAGDGQGRITLISQLEMKAEELGRRCLNPYALVSAGLYSDTIGEIGNGNEKGIATARDGRSGVVYEDIDFGSFGSDQITMPVFALSGEAVPIEIWLGHPGRGGSRLLDTVIYQKPSLWNTYQEESWKLPERVRGIVTLAFCLNTKVHIKGFSFERQKKSFSYLTAAEADGIYGDSFRVEGTRVLEIGNNVTLEYDGMEFDGGPLELAVWGSTPLQANEIHILFTPLEEGGTAREHLIRFAGGGTGETVRQTFPGICFAGKGKLAFLFLPGSRFDFAAFQFAEPGRS